MPISFSFEYSEDIYSQEYINGLLDAVEKNNPEALTKILNQSVPFSSNIPMPRQYLPMIDVKRACHAALAYAAERGMKEIVDLLAKHKIEPLLSVYQSIDAEIVKEAQKTLAAKETTSTSIAANNASPLLALSFIASPAAPTSGTTSSTPSISPTSM